eukprot:TRINITY_DN1591_c0_g1_i2.p2 TRINITY_DN1591_c0_g1~~TRINITY_DN1591_c0_g1_i2.p2  ORF type:complete len:261 (+),score=62.64 TRINITY_DN1591_c0_g1_i2:1180-1962(+)
MTIFRNNRTVKISRITENMMEATVEHGWVAVNNIHPNTTQDEIQNLFCFCGHISSIDVSVTPSGNKTALIQFWDKEAVTTAVLLSGALLQGQPILVELYIHENPETANAIPASAPQGGVDLVARQSKTAVVAKLLASGYQVGKETRDKAIAWDKGALSIKDKLEVLGTVAVTKANEVIEKYALNEKKDAAIAAVTNKANQIDSQYGLTEKAQNLKSKIEENEKIQSAVNKAQELSDKLGITKAFSIVKNTAVAIKGKIIE